MSSTSHRHRLSYPSVPRHDHLTNPHMNQQCFERRRTYNENLRLERKYSNNLTVSATAIVLYRLLEGSGARRTDETTVAFGSFETRPTLTADHPRFRTAQKKCHDFLERTSSFDRYQPPGVESSQWDDAMRIRVTLISRGRRRKLREVLQHRAVNQLVTRRKALDPVPAHST